MEITIKGRKDLRLPVLVGCCQLCLLSSQIAGFFDHQYLWKESMNTKDFFLGGNQQWKEGWGYHFCLGLANCVYHSNRLQNSLIINISAWNQLILYFFYLEITIKGRKDLRLPVLVGCCQLCLLSNRIPGFFGHQYLRRESIKTLDFLYGDNLQQKEGSETTSFGWVLGFAPIILSDFRIPWSLEATNWCNRFFRWGITIKERMYLGVPFWLSVGSCACHPIIDHQHLCKQSINAIYFLHRNNNQLGEGSDTIIFGWV